MAASVIISTIVDYIAEALPPRLYKNRYPESQWDSWVARVGERLAAHPEVEHEVLTYLMNVHRGAVEYLETHEDYTGAMPRVIAATEAWQQAIVGLQQEKQILR